MIISKKDINGNPVHLNEGFISDKIASAKERKELAKKIARYKNDFKFLKIITASNNKNVKDLLVTKGDFTKYSAFKDIEYIVTTIERVGGGVLPQDLSTVINNIKKGILITNNFSKEFKKAFSTDNDLVKLIYLGLTSSIIMSTTLAYSKYLVTNGEDGRIISISDGKHDISSKRACVSLGDFVIKDASGELGKVIKESIKSSSLSEAEDVDPIVRGNSGSISHLVNEILEVLGKQNFNSKDDANATKFDKILKLLFGYKKEILANGETKVHWSLMRSIISVTALFIGFVALARFCISEIYEARVKLADSLRDAAENLRATAEIEGITAEERDKKLKAAEKYTKLADKVDIECGVAESKADRELSRLDQTSDKQAKDIEKSVEGEIDFGI